MSLSERFYHLQTVMLTGDGNKNMHFVMEITFHVIMERAIEDTLVDTKLVLAILRNWVTLERKSDPDISVPESPRESPMTSSNFAET